MVATLGWSFDRALDDLTLPRYRALREEWRQRPPAHWLLASVLKYRAPAEGGLERAQGPSVEALKAAFGAEMSAPFPQ